MVVGPVSFVRCQAAFEAVPDNGVWDPKDKARYLGNVKFIGELFLKKMLSEKMAELFVKTWTRRGDLGELIDIEDFGKFRPGGPHPLREDLDCDGFGRVECH